MLRIDLTVALSLYARPRSLSASAVGGSRDRRVPVELLAPVVRLARRGDTYKGLPSRLGNEHRKDAASGAQRPTNVADYKGKFEFRVGMSCISPHIPSLVPLGPRKSRWWIDHPLSLKGHSRFPIKKNSAMLGLFIFRILN